MRLARVLVVIAAAAAAPPAFADRIAILPPTGASPEELAKLDADLAAGVQALGHTLVPRADVSAALADPAFSTRAPDALLALGKKLGADWILTATEDPAVQTERIEIGAAYEKQGRFELVAREVEKAASGDQVKEMLGVLLRPEGIGTGALPWENRPVVPPPPPNKDSNDTVTVIGPEKPKPEEPAKPKAPYGGGRMGFLTAGLGVDGLVVTPADTRGGAASFVGVIRGGVAILDTGLEPYAQLGGHLAGPSAVWLEVGIRWMGIAILHDVGGIGLHLGPSLHGGLFILPGSTSVAPDGNTYSTPTDATGTIALSLDGALRIAERVQLDAHLGELRWVPVDSGSTLSLGANIAGGVRF
ncbi:MAG: hypothetical protein U0414_07545 [Polyangiaceae bacterium]